MQTIIKNEPDFFKSAIKKVKQPKISKAWEDENIKKIKSELREHIIKEQQNLCAYCEIKLEHLDRLSIDHFQKRDIFPELTLEYNNLFVSCVSDNRCENYKDKLSLTKEDYNKIIHPVFENPEDYFEYDLGGKIIPKENLDKFAYEKAKFTIETFNLNDRKLVEDRKKIIISLIDILEYFNSWEEIRDNGFDFYFSLLRWILEIKGKINVY